jgi:hypothetical protein
VIAANYAYALRAGLCLIPEVDKAILTAYLRNFILSINDVTSHRRRRFNVYKRSFATFAVHCLCLPMGRSHSSRAVFRLDLRYQRYRQRTSLGIPILAAQSLMALPQNNPKRRASNLVFWLILKQQIHRRSVLSRRPLAREEHSFAHTMALVRTSVT